MRCRHTGQAVTAGSIRWRILKEDEPSLAEMLFQSYSGFDPMEDTESWVTNDEYETQVKLQRVRSDGGY